MVPPTPHHSKRQFNHHSLHERLPWCAVFLPSEQTDGLVENESTFCSHRKLIKLNDSAAFKLIATCGREKFLMVHFDRLSSLLVYKPYAIGFLQHLLTELKLLTLSTYERAEVSNFNPSDFLPAGCSFDEIVASFLCHDILKAKSCNEFRWRLMTMTPISKADNCAAWSRLMEILQAYERKNNDFHCMEHLP